MNYRQYLESAVGMLEKKEETGPQTPEDAAEVERFVERLPSEGQMTRADLNHLLQSVSEDPLYREKSGVTEWMRFQIMRRVLELRGEKAIRELSENTL